MNRDTDDDLDRLLDSSFDSFGDRDVDPWVLPMQPDDARTTTRGRRPSVASSCAV